MLVCFTGSGFSWPHLSPKIGVTLFAYLPGPPSRWLLTFIPKVAVVVTFSCILQVSNCMRLLLHANHASRDGARVIIWSPDIDAP